MILKGTATGLNTGTVMFDAHTACIWGDEKPSSEHHELTNLVELDESGTYACTDTHGREWTLTDYEGETELSPK